MYLFFGLFISILLFLLPGIPDISNIPLAELTLNNITDYIISLLWHGGLCWIICSLIMKSIDIDKIWPWRWTKEYIRMAICKITGFLLIGCTMYWTTQSFSNDKNGWVTIDMAWFASAVFALGIIFFSEESFYKELSRMKAEAINWYESLIKRFRAIIRFSK